MALYYACILLYKSEGFWLPADQYTDLACQTTQINQ